MDTERYLGKQLMTSDGGAGVVDDVLVTKDGTPRWLVVRDHGVFGGDIVLPFDQAALDGNTVRVAATRAEVHGGERYDPARHGAGAGLVSLSASAYDAADEPPSAP